MSELLKALEETGVSIADHDRTAILALASGLADDWVNKVVTAVVSNLPSGGIKNIEWAPVKHALIESLPSIDSATNDQISNLFNYLVKVLTPPAAAK